MSVTVGLVQPSFVVQEGLLAIFEGVRDIEVAFVAQDLPQMLRNLGSHEPEVVISEIVFPPIKGIAFAADGAQAPTLIKDRQLGNPPRVLHFSRIDDNFRIQRCREMGSYGCVSHFTSSKAVLLD